MATNALQKQLPLLRGFTVHCTGIGMGDLGFPQSNVGTPDGQSGYVNSKSLVVMHCLNLFQQI